MWHTRTGLIAMAGIFALLVPGVRADTLQLKNGNCVQGKYLGGTERVVQFQVNGKVRIYDVEGILSINFAAGSADGGIPSNNSDPKPGGSATSSSEAQPDGVLRTAGWSQARENGVAGAAIAAQNKQRSSGINLAGGRLAGPSRAARAALRANSEAKARVATVSARAVRIQRERVPILSD